MKKYEIDLRITGTIREVADDPAGPDPGPGKTLPEPKDPDPKPVRKLISSDLKTMEMIAAEVAQIARADSLIERVILQDGRVSGDLDSPLLLPVEAENAGKVIHEDPLTIRSRNNEIKGFSFRAKNNGGVRIKAPGNRLVLPVIEFNRVEAYQAGIAIDGGASYDPSLKTTIEGALVEEWGYTREQVAVRVGRPEDLPNLRQVERSFEVRDCSITGGARVGSPNYTVPIQTFWPVVVRENYISHYNGEGIQVKAGHCRIIGNALKFNFSKGRGALYDRGGNPPTRDNHWVGNLVEDTVFPFDHYGAVEGVLVEHNVFVRYARPGRFQLDVAPKAKIRDILIGNNSFIDQKRILGMTMGGWTWGDGTDYPERGAIKFRRNIYKNHFAKLVEDHSEVSGHWVSEGNLLYLEAEGPADADPLPFSDLGDYSQASHAAGAGAKWPRLLAASG